MMRQPFGAAALRAVSDHEQHRRQLPLHAQEDLDHVAGPLHRPEIREMNEYLFAARREALLQSGSCPGL